MAAAPTIYQKKLAQRRATADIDRLAKIYQKDLLDLADTQQDAFTKYLEEDKKRMAPYEAAMRQYADVSVPAYQAAMQQFVAQSERDDAAQAAYRNKVAQFQATLDEVRANPTEKVDARQSREGRDLLFEIDGRKYTEAMLPANYSIKDTPRQVTSKDKFGRPVTSTVIDKTVMRNREVPQFAEQAPQRSSASAPSPPPVPTPPPRGASFDNQPFAKRRDELSETLTREVDERKAAKKNVVMRRLGRGIMGA